MASDDDQRSGGHRGQQPSERPEYNVYRSRKGVFSKLRSPDLSGLREKARRGDGSGGKPGRGDKDSRRPSRFDPKPSVRRRWLKWILVAASVWLLIGIASFAISAQLQTFKLAGDAKSALDGNPFLLFSPQTILVIGTDARDPNTKEPGAATSQKCYDQQARGKAPSGDCPGFRADSLMLIRAGGATFRKLSIPRDSLAEIPGQSPQKINAGYSFGGAKGEIETIQNFLNIKIDHIVIMDFVGFADFIDSIGGVKVNVPIAVCGDISGGTSNGGITIRLSKGEHTLGGQEALAYARLRKPSPCPGKGKSVYQTGYDDLSRAAAQQQIINGVKDRMTDPLRLPYNYIKGPFIGWTAPKAFVTDMGALTLPQLVLSTVFAGSGTTDVLCGADPMPCSFGPGGSIVVPESERQRATKQLLGG